MVITTSLDVIHPKFRPNLLLDDPTERCKDRAYQLFAKNYVFDVIDLKSLAMNSELRLGVTGA